MKVLARFRIWKELTLDGVIVKYAFFFPNGKIDRTHGIGSRPFAEATNPEKHRFGRIDPNGFLIHAEVQPRQHGYEDFRIRDLSKKANSFIKIL